MKRAELIKEEKRILENADKKFRNSYKGWHEHAKYIVDRRRPDRAWLTLLSRMGFQRFYKHIMRRLHMARGGDIR